MQEFGVVFRPLERDPGQGQRVATLKRAQVPGGWLVFADQKYPVFVPDPNWEWEDPVAWLKEARNQLPSARESREEAERKRRLELDEAANQLWEARDPDAVEKAVQALEQFH